MKREIKLAGIAALTLGTAGVTNASSLFATQELGTGFQLRSALLSDFNPFISSSKELKCGEGSCGESKAATTKNTTETKAAEGKCGEAKPTTTKAAEGKCGEGKCGEAKPTTTKSAEAKCGEGKCGEGKCGESKPAAKPEPKK